MKRIGLDTSVVVRLLVGLPESEAESAMEFLLESHDGGASTILVSDLVCVESYFALRHHYDVPAREAARRLKEFLASGLVSPDGVFLAALEEFKNTGAGLIDRIIRHQYLRAAQEVVTFDKKFSQLDNVRSL